MCVVSFVSQGMSIKMSEKDSNIVNILDVSTSVNLCSQIHHTMYPSV